MDMAAHLEDGSVGLEARVCLLQNVLEQLLWAATRHISFHRNVCILPFDQLIVLLHTACLQLWEDCTPSIDILYPMH